MSGTPRLPLEWSWHHLQSLTNHIPLAIAYFDLAESCRFANEPARRLFGIAKDSEVGASLRDLLGHGEYERHAACWAAVKAGQTATYETVNALRHPGHLTAYFLPDFDDDGVVQGFCAQFVDSTGIKDAERARDEGARHLKAITDNMPALITYVNSDRVVTFANGTFKTWLGADPAVMVGRPLIDVIGPVMYHQRLDYLVRGFSGEQLSFEMPVAAKGGERHLKTTYIPDFTPDGTVAGIFVLVTDVTSMRLAEQQLRELARIDTLTRLPNRRDVEEKLAEALASHRRGDREMALLFLDIDHFKAINDTHGHEAGDQVLVEFAARLRTSVRESDVVARLGGDEFVVLLKGMSHAAESERVAEKIRGQLRSPIDIHGHRLLVTTSIGIAMVVGVDLEPASLMRRADQALYRAKRHGRDRYAIADDGGTDQNR